jgi:hypothetical protein
MIDSNFFATKLMCMGTVSHTGVTRSTTPIPLYEAQDQTPRPASRASRSSAA